MSVEQPQLTAMDYLTAKVGVGQIKIVPSDLHSPEMALELSYLRRYLRAINDTLDS